MLKIAPVIFLVFALLACSPTDRTVRVATFNISMGLEEAGAMARALGSGDNDRLHQVAEILQRVRPDIVLLNEFDFDPEIDAAALFNQQYLAQGLNGQAAIQYPYHFRAPVNTGIDSGLDLDGDSRSGGPGDAWGFGHFPGQYGMLVLSRFPLREASSRTFRNYRWSSLPGALRPANPDGSFFYPDPVWQQLRLSSKSHWDLVFEIGGRELHLLAHHPTPPVFDGPENRNGRRNHDEIRFWLEYTRPEGAPFIIDDNGVSGGISPGASFIIAGDFNADPRDGDSLQPAIGQILGAGWTNDRCIPTSRGAREANERDGGVNTNQQGDPAADTADFNDRYTGNLRLDYVLPSSGLAISGCGVFWPGSDEDGHGLVTGSDHRLVWLDLAL